MRNICGTCSKGAFVFRLVLWLFELLQEQYIKNDEYTVVDLFCYFLSGEGYSSDEDEFSQEEILAAMAEIRPAKKMRYRLLFVRSTHFVTN